jgi:hypothetical protein
MIYNPYYNTGIPNFSQAPAQQQFNQAGGIQYNPSPVQPVQNKNFFEWVQGEAGARGYMVPAGSTAWLMDSENSTFYIKSTDVNGIPQPLRIFDFKERVAISHNGPNGPVPENNYVTKDEMKAYIDEILKEKRNESSVQPESTSITVSELSKHAN